MTSTGSETQTGLRILQVSGQLPHGFGIVAKINGQDSTLLMDTLAPGIVVSAKFAARAGLKLVPELHVNSILDKPDSQATLAVAGSVRVGDFEFQDCPIFVTDNKSIVDDGVIGSEVFAQFLIEMDFSRSNLHLGALPLSLIHI